MIRLLESGEPIWGNTLAWDPDRNLSADFCHWFDLSLSFPFCKMKVAYM